MQLYLTHQLSVRRVSRTTQLLIDMTIKKAWFVTANNASFYVENISNIYSDNERKMVDSLNQEHPLFCSCYLKHSGIDGVLSGMCPSSSNQYKLHGLSLLQFCVSIIIVSDAFLILPGLSFFNTFTPFSVLTI